MINVDVFSESNLWNKKIKKKEFFFNKLVSSFPKKYKFIKKKSKPNDLAFKQQKYQKIE